MRFAPEERVMNIAIILLKSVMLIVAALAALWAAAVVGGLEAPAAPDGDCVRTQLRACFFTIV